MAQLAWAVGVAGAAVAAAEDSADELPLQMDTVEAGESSDLEMGPSDNVMENSHVEQQK